MLGTPAYPQAHDDRHALYVLNTILGGSMSSRLFQHIREERGLAYAVFSNLTTYSDAGVITIYAGCATDKVGEVVDLTLAELRDLRDTPVPADELQRAKDHLKGSLMLSLESTSSRMSQLARQEHLLRPPLHARRDAGRHRRGDGRGRAARGGGSVPGRRVWCATVVGPSRWRRHFTPERLRV